MIVFQGIELFTNFKPNAGWAVETLPATPGIYAEVYWPQRGIRFGETGRSVRGKIRHDIRWFRSMHDGSAPVEQLRRTLPIAEAAKATGVVGFEFYLVSADVRLEDKALRQETERFLFTWAEQADDFANWNRQINWR